MKPIGFMGDRQKKHFCTRLTGAKVQKSIPSYIFIISYSLPKINTRAELLFERYIVILVQLVIKARLEK